MKGDINIMRTDNFNQQAKMLGIEINQEQERMFGQYYEQLLHWNELMNLTGITQREEVYEKHFLDSLSLVKVIDLEKENFILDIGTGAGFPGIPLKIVFPHLRIVLLDSLGKRVDFLESLIEHLGLEGIVAYHGRAEDFAKKEEFRQQFDIVVSRAVSNLSTLSEYSLPFVRVGGFFIPYKSGDVEEEIKNSVYAIEILGGKLRECISFELPETSISRCLLKIEKVLDTPEKYPRRAGKPEKRPISENCKPVSV